MIQGHSAPGFRQSDGRNRIARKIRPLKNFLLTAEHYRRYRGLSKGICRCESMAILNVCLLPCFKGFEPLKSILAKVIDRVGADGNAHLILQYLGTPLGYEFAE
jgi:hypothetical protein